MTLKEKCELRKQKLRAQYGNTSEVLFNKEAMTTLQYEDSGCRQKQIQKEKEEFAIGFAEWMRKFIYDNTKLYFSHPTKELLEIYKTEKGL